MFAVTLAVFCDDAIVIMPDSKVGIGKEATTAELEVNGRVKDKTGFLMPVGTILPFAGQNVPEGWLLCDGKAYTSVGEDNEIYFELETAIGTSWGDGSTGTDSTTGSFNVPDLRGQFLRGVYHGAGNDPDTAARGISATGGNTGDAVGSKQADAFQGHEHSTYVSGSASSWTNDGSDYGNIRADTTEIKNKAGYGTARYSTETRPVNVYVNYIIKY